MTDQPETDETEVVETDDQQHKKTREPSRKEYLGRRLLTPGQQRDMHGGISGVTHWRWQNDPKLNYPDAIVINTIPYRWSDELEAWCESFRVSGKEDAA